LSVEATVAANKLGRLYPPIPFGETKFSSRSEKDFAGISGGSDGGWTTYHSNDREGAFWSDFERTHPLPPEEIERKQVEIEHDILASKNWKMRRPKDIDSALKADREAVADLNYPPEALTDDALHWAYVVHQNQQYQKDVRHMPIEVVQAVAKNDGADLAQLTNSLTAEQIVAANAWKIAYLQRLKRENTDKSYIDAYLRAWNLSSNVVFNAMR